MAIIAVISSITATISPLAFFFALARMSLSAECTSSMCSLPAKLDRLNCSARSIVSLKGISDRQNDRSRKFLSSLNEMDQ